MTVIRAAGAEALLASLSHGNPGAAFGEAAFGAAAFGAAALGEATFGEVGTAARLDEAAGGPGSGFPTRGRLGGDACASWEPAAAEKGAGGFLSILSK